MLNALEVSLPIHLAGEIEAELSSKFGHCLMGNYTLTSMKYHADEILRNMEMDGRLPVEQGYHHVVFLKPVLDALNIVFIKAKTPDME